MARVTKIDKAIYLLAEVWAELPLCGYGASTAVSNRGVGRIYRFYFNSWWPPEDATTRAKPMFSLFSLVGQDNKDSYYGAAQELIQAWRKFWNWEDR